MAYLFRQKISIEDLVEINSSRKKVLLYEPENYLAGLYEHYLQQHNFDVKHCPHLAELKQSIKAFSPDLLIFNVENWDGKKKLLAFNFKRDFPLLPVISTGYNVNSEDLTALMDYGIQSHINRRATRPEDIAIIVKNVLQH